MSVRTVLSTLPLLALAACGGNPPSVPASAPAQQAAAQAPAGGPAGDDTLAPLFGTWALDPAQCGGEVLTISNTRFEGPGGGCDITGFSDDGNGTFTAAMDCGSGTERSAEKIAMRPIFAPTGEGIDLVYLNRDNLKATVLRCTAARP